MSRVMPTFRKVGSVVAAAVCLLTFLNFPAFLVVAIWLGGDALNGKEENGRYYLASHGRYTEVSRATFEYSAAHARSLAITIPLMLVAGAVTASRSSKRSSVILHGKSSTSAGGA